MVLLDVSALVALAWDSHVHHAAARTWFAARGSEPWAISPVTESGFLRVSCNPKVLPSPIAIGDARRVLRAFRGQEAHTFLVEDVFPTDPDVPPIHGHRQVADAQLLALARRHGGRLATFDAAIATLADGDGVELLTARTDS